MMASLRRLSAKSRHRALLTWICLLLTAGVSVGLPACSHTVLPVLPVGLKNCFEDLPLAEGALNAPKSNYRFKGVKLVTPKGMADLVRKRFPKNASASYKPPPAGSQVCAFAFTGDFAAGQVAEAPQNASGKAAIVLTTTNRQLLFSFVLSKLPVGFTDTV
jgi:predicted secreted protein